MALFCLHLSPCVSVLGFILLLLRDGVNCTTFTLVNKCDFTGCVSDLNRNCPTELKAKNGLGRLSIAEAARTVHQTPASRGCTHKSLNQLVPDRTVMRTMMPQVLLHVEMLIYTITFCPNLSSLKSSREPPPEETGDVSGSGDQSSTETQQQPIEEESLANSYLADMAIGESSSSTASFVLRYAILLPVTLIFCWISL